MDDEGNPIIDLPELARIFPHAVTDPGHKPDTYRTPEKNTETAALRELVAVLKEDKEGLTMERERVRNEGRAEVERERAERERLLGLLERLSGNQPTSARGRRKSLPPPWLVWPIGRGLMVGRLTKHQKALVAWRRQ